jgi:hypothetical protein
MPRPNKARKVYAEEHLAKRIAVERAAATPPMTLEGLAKRMTDAGCAIQASAIYKIEQGDPPRRITVDELVGFARVFGTTPEDLLTAPELRASKRLAPLFAEWRNIADRRHERERLNAEDSRRSGEISREISLIAGESTEALAFYRDFLAAITPDDPQFRDDSLMQFYGEKAREGFYDESSPNTPAAKAKKRAAKKGT